MTRISQEMTMASFRTESTTAVSSGRRVFRTNPSSWPLVLCLFISALWWASAEEIVTTNGGWCRLACAELRYHNFSIATARLMKDVASRFSSALPRKDLTLNVTPHAVKPDCSSTSATPDQSVFFYKVKISSAHPHLQAVDSVMLRLPYYRTRTRCRPFLEIFTPASATSRYCTGSSLRLADEATTRTSGGRTTEEFNLTESWLKSSALYQKFLHKQSHVYLAVYYNDTLTDTGTEARETSDPGRITFSFRSPVQEATPDPKACLINGHILEAASTVEGHMRQCQSGYPTSDTVHVTVDLQRKFRAFFGTSINIKPSSFIYKIKLPNCVSPKLQGNWIGQIDRWGKTGVLNDILPFVRETNYRSFLFPMCEQCSQTFAFNVSFDNTLERLEHTFQYTVGRQCFK
eukprot:scpid78985/ scgid6603/ 